MCGIVGIVDSRGAGRPIKRAVLESMTGSLAHRGPDGCGYHVEPGVGLGHRRLSIIDLATGQQPLFNEDQSVCVTYNGEIYNFRELSAELTAAGHSFRTHCDTEVIVHAWEQWGAACVDRFNGMFAFGIWDRNRKTAFIARDRLGIKPLHYTLCQDGMFLFASELKALTCYPGLVLDLSVTAVEDFLTYGYVPEPNTIYRAIAKLEPGHSLELDTSSGKQRLRQYWNLDTASFGAGTVSESTVLEELPQRLTQAVERRMIADVPLGAFLSGGVDSSAVVAAMCHAAGRTVTTCSISFDDPEYDESLHARQVADLLQTRHTEKQVQTDDFGLLDRLVDIYDEPYADSSAIPTYRVCQAAREQVTVALSGDGGDENHAGYRRYRMFMLEEAIRSRLPLGIRRILFGPLGRFYPKLDWAPRIFRGKTTFQALARDLADAYLHGVSFTARDIRHPLYTTNFREALQGYDARAVFDRHIQGRHFHDTLSQIQYLDMKTYLPGDILTKVDRASMAHSLEVRVPFLDHQLVEWVAQIPPSLKLRRGVGKYALKKSLEGVLPNEVLYRSKMGFAVPLPRWFRGPLADRVRQISTSPILRDAGIFDSQRLATLIERHVSGQRDYSATIWCLLMLEGFLRIRPHSGRMS